MSNITSLGLGSNTTERTLPTQMEATQPGSAITDSTCFLPFSLSMRIRDRGLEEDAVGRVELLYGWEIFYLMLFKGFSALR
eukprot:1394942-Amorphochlora_amoeboformis.AAC.1